MNWEMIGVLSGIIFIQGCILIAAAKSIFVTQKEYDSVVRDFNSKLYDKGITIFVPRKEWEKSMIEREHRRDASQRVLCTKMGEMQKSMETMSRVQNETNVAIGNLLGRFESQLKKSGES